jgi:putative flippase GtrA
VAVRALTKSRLAEWGSGHSLTGQMVRYAMVGGTVALTYIGVTLLLSGPAGLPILAAVAIGYVTAVCLHFTLQRAFVFRHHRDVTGFALPFREQIKRYIVLGSIQYGLNVAALLVLPALVGVSKQVVYLGTVVALSLASFTILRTRTFHGAGDNQAQ